MPFRVWTSLEGIDSAYGERFDHALDLAGSHAVKLNGLAAEIGKVAGDDDLIMFLDGDAFPIADPMPLVRSRLEQAPLVAVRRKENAGDPQPHPCFCVTHVGTWKSLPGDWSEGFTWIGPRGKPITDVGANLLHRLESHGMPWSQVLRSSDHRLHPLLFGIYGNVVYHHGAGFRWPFTRSDIAKNVASTGDELQEVRRIGTANHKLSQAIFDRIARDDPDWLTDLTQGAKV